MAKKIVLDAGHALNTAGNQTPDGIFEWDLNNKVALAIEKQLSEYEVEVTRVDDRTGKVDITLAERVARTNKIMPNAFVSIHHNAFTSKWGTHGGVEVFYNANRKNEIEKAMAIEMSANLSKNTGIQNRGAKTAAFYVLTCNNNILAILAEGGFMDSTVDHPVITSAKGQEGYAKAIADVLIKQLKLEKKAIETRPVENNTKTTTGPVKAGDNYILVASTPGYYTSADAAAKKDARVNVVAGNYFVFSVANSMINITKTKGQAGSWINPGTVAAPPVTTSTTVQTPTVGSNYTLAANTPGYYTSADASAKKDQRVTVLAGTYFIFNISNGMLNITKTKGQAGSWINPAANTAPATTTAKAPVVGDKYTLAKNSPGYYTAANAKAKTNQVATVLAGDFFIFNIADGMVNLTKVKGQPGTWVNPT